MTIAIGVISIIEYKQYQRHRFHQKNKYITGVAATPSEMYEVKMFETTIIHPTTAIEVKFIRKESDRGEAPVEAWGVVFTVCLVTTIAAMFLLLTAPVWSRKKKTSIPQRSEAIPCRNCQFFEGNQYLKCAVYPSIVLTRQAIDCSDYQPCEPHS